MASVHGERWEHLGLMAWMIHDCGLLRLLDARLLPEAPAELTPGEAVAGMLRKGLGCATRPRALTPPCVAHHPRARLLRAGVAAPLCQRVTRGRTRDALQAAGGDRWCSDRAWAVWAPAGSEPRVPPLDTTRVARRGAAVPDRDEPALRLTPGDAADHRPDRQPAVWAVIVAPEGGVPLVRTSGEGQASETPLFQARAPALRHAWASAPAPR
jgi:Domain of unknown function (DUF4277)